MNLIHRPMLLSDIEEAIDGIRDGFLYTDPADRQDLARFWRELMTREDAVMCIIEDRDAPVGKRFHYSAVGVYLTDEYAETLKRGEAAYVSRRILSMWLAGRAPLLNAKQIQIANSTTGLRLLVIHTGLLPEDLDPVAGRHIRDSTDKYCYYGMGGFNYREILFEVYGDFQKQWFTGIGMLPKADNNVFFAAQKLPTPFPEHYPYLMGVTSEESAVRHGYIIRHGFVTGQPRFFFKSLERKMLLFAMEGLTDEEVAKYLCVSLGTVRKYWEAIYERVGEVAPELLETAVGKQARSGGHGAQKRRRLLNYIRHNIEETRPYESPLRWE